MQKLRLILWLWMLMSSHSFLQGPVIQWSDWKYRCRTYCCFVLILIIVSIQTHLPAESMKAICKRSRQNHRFACCNFSQFPNKLCALWHSIWSFFAFAFSDVDFLLKIASLWGWQGLLGFLTWDQLCAWMYGEAHKGGLDLLDSHAGFFPLSWHCWDLAANVLFTFGMDTLQIRSLTEA